ncbi:MAG: hypothetical protein H6716_29145 [Polyangiaceae bacterium]|nr:hypothetical protein [Polyangiaceae bacterium]
MSELRKRREAGGSAAVNSVAYLRVNNDQIRVLRSGLGRWSSCPTHMSDEQAAALVLVAGRVLCSDNDGSTFEWMPVLQSLGWTTSRPTDLYQHLVRGFRYWGLKLYTVRGHRTHYLASTLLAGGLPVAWLASEKHPVGALVRRLLSRAGRFERRPSDLEWDGDTRPSLASLDPETVRDLCTLLADELWDLRAELGSTGTSPSSAALARFGPQWTARISIQWSEARDLETVIDALLAVADAGSVGLSWVRFDTFWDVGDQGGLLREVRLVGASIPSDKLPPELAPKSTNECNEFIVSALTPDGGRHVIGRLERTSNGFRVLPSTRVLRLRGRKGVTLLVAAVGTPGLALTPPGGETLDTQEPWVFDANEAAGRPGMHRLIGTGDVKTSRPATWVSILETSQVDVDSDTLPRLLSLPEAGERRCAFHLGDSARITTAEGEEYRVRLAVPDEDPSSLSARGELWWAAGGRRAIWLGVPTLWIERGESRSSLPMGALEWRPKYVRPLAWRLVRDSPPAGRVVIRHRDADGQSTTGEFDILPRDFRVKRGEHCELLVTGTGIVQVETDAANVTSSESTFHLTWLEHELLRPELPATVQFMHGAKLDVDLPTLHGAACFVDRDGHVIRSGSRMALERTRGVRAVGYARGKLVVWVRSGRRNWRPICERSPTKDGCSTVFMDELFATMDSELRGLYDHDGRLSLCVKATGESPGRPVIEVGWHDVGFLVDADAGVICAHPSHAAACAKELPRMELHAISLAHPTSGVVAWPSSEVACRWDANPEELEAGPWLFWGAVDGELRGRPTYQLVQHLHPTEGTVGSESSDSIEGWAWAAQLGTRHDREDAWDRLLTTMAEDVDHPGWLELRAVLANAGQLPAAALDVLRCLGEHPRAATTLLLYQADVGDLARSARKLSEVGFLPGMANLTHWGKAVRTVLRVSGRGTINARLLGSALDAFRLLTGGHFNTRDAFDAPDGCNFVGIILALAKSRLHGVPAPYGASLDFPPQFLEKQLGYWGGELRRRNPEESVWPSGLTFDLEDDELGRLLDRVDAPFEHRSVLLAPRLLADMTFGKRDCTRQGRRDLITARTFDPASFDQCHALALALHIVRDPNKAADLLLKD